MSYFDCLLIYAYVHTYIHTYIHTYVHTYDIHTDMQRYRHTEMHADIPSYRTFIPTLLHLCQSTVAAQGNRVPTRWRCTRGWREPPVEKVSGNHKDLHSILSLLSECIWHFCFCRDGKLPRFPLDVPPLQPRCPCSPSGPPRGTEMRQLGSPPSSCHHHGQTRSAFNKTCISVPRAQLPG